MDLQPRPLTIYISGSLAGSRDLESARNRYERLGEICTSAGFHAYIPHKQTDPVWAAELNSSTVYERDLEELSSADVVVAYLGEPSLGVGAELAIAMQLRKWIIAIWESDARMSRFVAGLLQTYDRAFALTFDSEQQGHIFVHDTLKSILTRRDAR